MGRLPSKQVGERRAQNLEHMSFELGEFIEEEDSMAGQRDLARYRELTAADEPHIGDGLVGARHGCAVTKAVRRPASAAGGHIC